MPTKRGKDIALDAIASAGEVEEMLDWLTPVVRPNLSLIPSMHAV